MFVGYRGWHVRTINGELTLTSPSYKKPWAPGENVAQCAECILTMDEDCTCGFYALKEPDPELVTYNPDIIGQVFMYGKVVDGERGYRAKRAMVSLLLIPSIKPMAEAELNYLSARYNAPLVIAKEPILYSITVARRRRLIAEGKLKYVAAMEQYRKDWSWMSRGRRRSGENL